MSRNNERVSSLESDHSVKMRQQRPGHPTHTPHGPIVARTFSGFHASSFVLFALIVYRLILRKKISHN